MRFNLTIEDYTRYTYKDYEKWEGDWELIHGFPYTMSPAPNRHHQRFGSPFVTEISNVIKKYGPRVVMLFCMQQTGLSVTTQWFGRMEWLSAKN